MPSHFRSKEVSWLAFNNRVLQEAQDPSNPLMERMKFLGIYSNNLDEFFSVRVATLKRLIRLGKYYYKKLDIPDPKKTLAEINDILAGETARYNTAYDSIIDGLADHGIRVVNEKNVPKELREYVLEYFESKVRPHLMPIMMKANFRFTRLRDDPMYLAVRLSKKTGKGRPAHALIEIPTPSLPRFKVLPKVGNDHLVMYLDDIIRFGLPRIFATLPYDTFESYAVKFTRDAEMNLDDDFNESFLDKLSEAIQAREEGDPVRLNFDENIPKHFLRLLLKKLNFSGDDTLFPGAHYHNRKDLINFPELGGSKLYRKSSPPIPHPRLAPKRKTSLFQLVRKKDLLLHFPYHSFNPFLDLLREAIMDPLVRSIQLTHYRLAEDSAVAKALISAVRAGKKATVLVEPTARFDEEANISWAEQYRKGGVRVILGVPGLKVHGKLCLITRREGGKERRYSVISTGNFNEDTAHVYTDHMLLTANPDIGRDVIRVFRFFEYSYRPPTLKHLICSPFETRHRLNELVKNEIENARKGKKSGITLKLNNLSDPKMVDLLYQASNAGVPVKLIIRGMFSLITDKPGLSDNIEAISIVDKYLEHSRIFSFENDGAPLYFITSADLLPRNLDGRIEITCPIYDESLKAQLAEYLKLQWRDGVKGRRLDRNLTNKLCRPKGKSERSQIAIEKYLRSRSK
ncbi:MAG: polyphosphate kinase 1 [Verrucomicrobiota bacterium]